MMRRILGIVASVLVLAGWNGPPAPVTYVAQMTGAKETPANTVAGTGTATLTVNGTKLQYSIVVEGLSGPATMAHIHVGAMGVAGPPVYTFDIKKVAAGTLATGSIDLTKAASAGVSGDSLVALIKSGNAYVNVHTAAHPSGEIRGQVMKK